MRSRLAGEQRRHLGQVVCVLEQRVREGRDGALVHLQHPRQLAHLQPVVALEVDDLDRARGRHLVDQRRRPLPRDVELEAQVRMASSRRAIGSNVGGSPSPSEFTKRTGDGVAPERLVQRGARLREREVQRRGLERPVAPAQQPVPRRAAPATGRSRPGGRRRTPASTRPRARTPARRRAARSPRSRAARRPPQPVDAAAAQADQRSSPARARRRTPARGARSRRTRSSAGAPPVVPMCQVKRRSS